MTPAQPCCDESRRLDVLRSYAVLDTAPDPGLHDLVLLASRICETPIALISLLDERRQWFAAKVGWEMAETPREISFCQYAPPQPGLLIVPNATLDARFAQNPSVTGEPGIRFYAGVPLVSPEAAVLGTLCVIDRVPRSLTPAQEQTLQVLARQIMVQLELRRQAREHEQAMVSTGRLAAIVESSDDAIISRDLNGLVTSWNPGAERMFGYRADQIVGTSIRRLIPADRQEEEDVILSLSRLDEKVRRFETVRKTLTGELLDVSINVCPLKDHQGRIVGAATIARDMTVEKKREREIVRLSQLYSALSQVNQAIVWSSTRGELFAKVCRTLVEQGRFDMAWIGWCEFATHRIIPVAEWGDHQGHVQTIEMHDDDRPTGHSPSGIACREARTYICNDLLSHPSAAAWGTEVRQQHWRALAAFPIRMQGAICAVLTVYADTVNFFQEREIALLEEAAVDISFALDNFEREEGRQQAEALARNERRFSETMIESMPGVLYFYDDEGHFLRWNRNFETVTGYSSAEIAQMHPLNFFAEEDQPLLVERIGEVFAKGESSVEAPFRAKDGRTTPYFFTGRRVLFEGKTCLVGMGIDISKRKETEERLAESERRYRELVEHANSIILRWGCDGRVTLLNEFGQRFFGYSAEEILGRNVLGTIVPATESSGRDLTQLMEQIRANPKAFEQNINENVCRDGRRVWISWTNRVERDDRGHVLEILSIGTDITEQRQAEQSIRELNASLEQRVTERTAELRSALVRAEAADRLKSAFLATMSHELRTPLNSIIGFTSTVLQGLAGPLNEEQIKQLGMVLGSARHLLDLIKDVLDLSKIEAGQFKVRRESFNLRASIESTLTSVQPLALQKGLQLTAVISPEVGEMVSDRRRVEQILLNLLNNAIKFTDRGGVTISAQPTVDYSPSPGTPPQPAVLIQVADTGIGIRQEDIATLFQPFRQLDIGIARQHEGTGLGLAICQRLAGLLGGRISLTSEWSKGSEFSVLLPLQKPSET